MRKEMQVQLQHDLQHPLAVDDRYTDKLSKTDGSDDKKTSKRRNSRRRGSRRRSSVDTKAENDTFFGDMNRSNNQRRHSHKQQEEEEESPAFQSIVDIISEMKRLPSISIYKDEENDWKRVRRHSEPPQKNQETKKPAPLTPIHEKNTNSFLMLEKEQDADESALVPTQESPKRTRSQSVPSTTMPFHPENTSNRRLLYTPHLKISEAAAAVRSHTLYSGILCVSGQDSSEANVECEELDASIYIFGSRNRNRALDGDQVVVELVDVDDMLDERQAKRQARQTRRLSAISLQGPSSLASNHGLSSIPENNVASLDQLKDISDRPKYCGKVVCILERPRNMLFSGTLSLNRPHAPLLDNGSRDKKDPHGPKIIWFIPADKRLPLVAVPIKHAPPDFIKYHEEYKNRIFIGSIQRWPATSLHPFGVVEKEIGWIGELGVHSRALMADHHIKDMDFTDSVKKATGSVPTGFTDQERKIRRDLTKEGIHLFTMGEQSKDIDHAFSIVEVEKGLYEIGIHVTDVSKYVRLNTPLDREARERSCAIELVDKHISILPPSFLESHCSFSVGKERLAYSVMCRFTENGILLHTWIGKTIVSVKQHVQPKNLTKDAETLLKISKKLQINRLRKLGGTSLAKSCVSFELAESGYPEKIERQDQHDEDVLIQELLIVANTEVGQKISSRFPDQAMLYRQDSPKLSKLSTVQDYFGNDPSTGTVQGLIELIRERETVTGKQETLMHVVQKAIPISKYYSAGSLDISKYSHFEYSASIYAVFTEPVHNYASIHAQRQLSAALRGERQDSEDSDAIDKIARHCNSSCLSKLAAEQDSKKLFVAAYVYRQCLCTEAKKISVEAYAIEFNKDMVVLYIPEFDLELPTVINETSLPHGHHSFNADLNEITLYWDGSEKTQTLRFLSSVLVYVYVDMKAIRPSFKIEFMQQV